LPRQFNSRRTLGHDWSCKHLKLRRRSHPEYPLTSTASESHREYSAAFPSIKSTGQRAPSSSAPSCFANPGSGLHLALWVRLVPSRSVFGDVFRRRVFHYARLSSALFAPDISGALEHPALHANLRDSWLMSLVTFGEGYHNYHHEFPYDYRSGVKPWQFDLTKWLIWTLSKVGWQRSCDVSRLIQSSALSLRLPGTENKRPISPVQIGVQRPNSPFVAIHHCVLSRVSDSARLSGHLRHGHGVELLFGKEQYKLPTLIPTAHRAAARV
jgi:hypothetical protein